MAEERTVGDATSNETAEIKYEIERTRVEMSETIGEIQERLRPDHLIQQAKDGMKDAAADKARSIMTSAGETAATVAYQARGVGDTVASYARQHPLQIAVTIGALAWWMLRSSDSGDDDWYGESDTSSWSDDGGMAYDDGMSYPDGRTTRNRVGEFTSSARETVGDYASTASKAVGEYASTARETVGEYAESARESARRASEAARRAASTATESVDDWVTGNPLAAGAVALAVGAAIGMSVPATELENRTMGEARDRAWERASKAASEIKENVTKKVENVAGNFVGENILDPITGGSNEPMGRA